MSVPSLKRSISEISDRISRASPKKEKKVKRASTSVPAFRDIALNYVDLAGSTSEVELTADQQWYDKFAPKRVDEVALHKKKLEEVRHHLQDMVSGKSDERILLLSGPAGCSKSTSVKLICDDLVPRCRDSSVVTVTGREVPSYTEYLTESSSISPIESFNEFLLQSKYLIGRNLSVLIVEDLPNVFHEPTLKRFRDSILTWLFASDRLPPLVICLTECQLADSGSSFGIDSSFIAETILGKEILTNPLLHRIKFNPINTTLMSKHLQLIVQKVRKYISPEKYQRSGAFIKGLASNSGDIRSGIAALQFWCISSFDEDNSIFTRESSTSYFHAVGKVVYGSKDNENDMVTTNDLIERGVIANDTFKLGILENYSKLNKSQFPVCFGANIAETLSLTDTLRPLNDESLYYCLGKVRNICSDVQTSNHSVHGQANFPREYKMIQEQKRFHLQLEDFVNVEFYKYFSLWSTKDAILYGSCFGPDIRKNLSFKAKSLKYYLDSLEPNSKEYNEIATQYHNSFTIDDLDITERVGGTMHMMHATSELTTAWDDSKNKDSLTINNKKLDRLKALHTQSLIDDDTSNVAENHEFEEDPIMDSDSERPFDVEEEGDSELFEILSQRPKQERSIGTLKTAHEDVTLSDSDIENL
ncbi:unnamed protein product [Kluyveromyces dobzhanskii CBS 2104]|uniref:WGS project CCBQ000000000 data, contig 00009 n=1 Tax=Kluyveromyces dobzhanskii CBS 2104 TaxID=1427455 RepID=A0A0A8L576_9SACH|nr:unnamed protein product [Kluyveromyces dobzhanskii CBS 2104]